MKLRSQIKQSNQSNIRRLAIWQLIRQIMQRQQDKLNKNIGKTMGNICHEQQTKADLISTADVNVTQLYDRNAPTYPNAKHTDPPQLSTYIQDIIHQNLPLQPEPLQGKKLNPLYLTQKKVIYDGQWKNQKPHGKGEVYLDNGAYFSGYFKDGEADCKDGLFVYPDGSFFRGQVKQSSINGKGKFKSQSVTYTGEWKNNKPHGEGREQFDDGNSYFGEFRDGYKEGAGQFNWHNGMIYKGEFKKGYMWGRGKLERGTSYYDGDFEKNQKVSHHKDVIIETDTGKYEGPLFDGEMNGDGVFTWYDRKVYHGSFSKGNLHGIGFIDFPNGQRVHGQWQNGENIMINKIQKI